MKITRGKSRHFTQSKDHKMTKNNNFLILTVIITLGCKTVEVEKELNLDSILNEQQTPIEFRKYVREFKQDAYSYGPFKTNYEGQSILLQFYNSIDNTKTVTECSTENGVATLYFDYGYWSGTDYNERKRLIYRNISLCMFKRTYESTCIGNQYPKSITANGGDCNQSLNKSNIFFCSPYKEYYLRELFHPESPAPSWANTTIQPCETPQDILAKFKLTNTNSTTKRIDIVLVETGKTNNFDKNQFYYNVTDPKIEWSFDIGDKCERGKEYTVTFTTTKSTIAKKFVYDGKSLDFGALALE